MKVANTRHFLKKYIESIATERLKHVHKYETKQYHIWGFEFAEDLYWGFLICNAT